MKLAVQLYSVRDHIKDGADMLDILGKVKVLGFEGVEFAGYFGLAAPELRKKLDDLGLTAVGTHIGLDNYLPENLQATLDYGKKLGLLYMGVGGAPHNTAEEAENTGRVLGEAGVEARKLGMDTYYHNHTEEFTVLPDGRTPMDIIKSHTNMELDAYWSFCAGVENRSYITENKDKIVLIHIKDGKNRKPLALGEGECDLKAVVDGAKAAGVEWLVLENDDPKPCGLKDIERSMKWLKANV